MNERLLEKLRAINRSDQLLTKEQYVMLQRLQRLKWERVRRAQLRTGQKKLSTQHEHTASASTKHEHQTRTHSNRDHTARTHSKREHQGRTHSKREH